MRTVRTMARSVAVLLGLAWLSACATAPLETLPPPPVHANELWTIIDHQCVPGQLERGDPRPCAMVVLDGGREHGYVVLRSREGVAQYLILPTDKVTGIEDPKMLEPGRPNYFAAAWDARHLVEAKLGRPQAPDALSVTINSPYGRSQDQLHIHVSCQWADAQAEIKAIAPRVDGRWSGPYTVKGHAYEIRRLNNLSADPFQILARTMPGAARAMGAWTMALTAAPDGRGFLLLAGRADPAHGEKGSAESMQDHACHGR